VLDALVAGRQSKVIAHDLGLSVRTVEVCDRAPASGLFCSTQVNLTMPAREIVETTKDWSSYWLNDREFARRPWVTDEQHRAGRGKTSP
jgi:hypothetical protein